MVKISDLSDELLVKIISFLPTKEAVSTSILSKQWEFLWMWLPKLEFYFSGRPESSACLRDFIDKNLPLHKAPIIESLLLDSYFGSVEPKDLKPLVGIAVSRCVRKLSIYLDRDMKKSALSLPGSLYTSNSLVTLKLDGKMILVDVPPTVCLPSLKTLRLECVTYSNDDSLRLLLSCCPVLEDLFIDRKYYDNLRAVVIDVPSLQRLNLIIDDGCSTDGYVIVTPSLKYFQVVDDRVESSCLIKHMPELEEADIWVMEDNEKDIEMLLKSITTVKRLSIRIRFNSGKETVYSNDIVFSRLENLKLCICSENWSMLLVQLLQDSPNLKILNLFVDYGNSNDEEYEPVSWSNNEGPVPKCLLDSLETFKFKGYDCGEPEDRDFLSFILKHARCLKSTIILQRGCYVPVSP